MSNMKPTIECFSYRGGAMIRVVITPAAPENWREEKQYRVHFKPSGEVERVQYHKGVCRNGWNTARTRGPKIMAAIEAAQMERACNRACA